MEAMKRERFDQLFQSTHNVIQNPDEFYWLVNLVETLNPKTIIEIGVADGGSLKFWEQLLPENGLLIGVDICDSVRWDYRNSDRRIHLVEGDSRSTETILKVKQLLSGASIDFLYIDGDHGYEYVKTDFLNYSPLVRSKGLVGFHDISLHETHEGPTRFFNEIEGKKDALEIQPDMGTGVWWKP